MTDISSSLPLSLAEGVSVLPDPQEVGVFLRFTAPGPVYRHVFALGDIPELARFTCCHRYEPFWMTPAAGTKAGDVPVETQYLLAELADGRVALFVPLIDGLLRASLQGTGETGLEVVVETGDPAARQAEATALFVAVGDDVDDLLERAAQSVSVHLGTTRLRVEKPLPDFVNSFGWCTWDAFYQEVTHDKVREGLESFEEIGIQPRFLILDDGWQSEQRTPSGERRLTALTANAKFDQDLSPTVQMSKDEFGVETFLVWHAMNGYWGGLDAAALPGYGTIDIARESSPGILHHVPNVDTFFGPIVGVVPPPHIYRFFHDYHRRLRAQGVDGVKVDGQAALETVARGLGTGGRVPLMAAYHEALEGSVAVHFEGRIINCMSCANEMLYNAPASSLTRTSTDFWPNRPETHGAHLYTNAQVGAWFGHFIHPDWDMFQSGHPMGAYHAAGRAVSGSPVYVSDKPNSHNATLLRKLVTPEGRVLRCPGPGIPTRDCLFHDVTKEPVLLKIKNYVDPGAAILGAFNARYAEAGTEPITGSVSPVDVAGYLPGERFAVYAHYAQELRVMTESERWEITLPQLECEVFTIVPILEDGFAPIGVTDYFNAAGVIGSEYFGEDEKTVQVILYTGGNFLAYSALAPLEVFADDEPIAFTYDSDAKSLRVTLPQTETVLLRVVLP